MNNKKIYIYKTELSIKAHDIWLSEKDLELINYQDYPYFYNCVPDNYSEWYENNLFSNLNVILDRKFPFQCFINEKKKYFIFPSGERIYEKDINLVYIKHIYETIESPDIEKLKKSLGFYKFTELLFDREQELKSFTLL